VLGQIIPILCLVYLIPFQYSPACYLVSLMALPPQVFRPNCLSVCHLRHLISRSVPLIPQTVCSQRVHLDAASCRLFAVPWIHCLPFRRSSHVITPSRRYALLRCYLRRHSDQQRKKRKWISAHLCSERGAVALFVHLLL
jgi:hypothetical protein